jgi:hypothetical protein
MRPRAECSNRAVSLWAAGLPPALPAVLAASSLVLLTCESLHLVSALSASGDRFRHDSDRTRAVSCKRGAERSQS